MKKKNVSQVIQKKKATKQLFQVDSMSDSDPDTQLVDDNEDYDIDFINFADLEDQENFERNEQI